MGFKARLNSDKDDSGVMSSQIYKAMKLTFSLKENLNGIHQSSAVNDDVWLFCHLGQPTTDLSLLFIQSFPIKTQALNSYKKPSLCESKRVSSTT